MLQLNLPEATKRKSGAKGFADYMPASRETVRPGVPAVNTPGRTTISFHRHEVVVRREGKLSNLIAALEGSFLVISTIALITISGSSVAVAATIMGV